MINKEKTDLQKAFQAARKSTLNMYWHKQGATPKYSGENGKGLAVFAMSKARQTLAALPVLQTYFSAALNDQETARKAGFSPFSVEREYVDKKLIKARKALRSGQAFRYAGPVWGKGYTGTWQSEIGHYFCESDSYPFRNVTPSHAILGSNQEGFYTDPYCEGVCSGLVVQLPSRKGVVRYAPAYQISTDDLGFTVDLSDIVEPDNVAERENFRRRTSKNYWTPAMENAGHWAQEAMKTAKKEAARKAQSLAKTVAEKECEHQTAWRAGSQFAMLLEEEQEARKEALQILTERRQAKSDPKLFPALCAALRSQVSSLVSKISKNRKKRADLVNGDDSEFLFWPNEDRLRTAFCEGAGLSVFPS